MTHCIEIHIGNCIELNTVYVKLIRILNELIHNKNDLYFIALILLFYFKIYTFPFGLKNLRSESTKRVVSPCG